MASYRSPASTYGVNTVYVVGKALDEERWRIIGIFDDELKALKACQTADYFIGPLLLNQLVRDFTKHRWPGKYFPMAEADESAAELDLNQ